jgi:hypothetical protein
VSSLTQFFQSPHVLALFIAILIFLMTIFLVVKRWIGFSVTLLLLLFSLVAGLVINHQQIFQDYIHSYSSSATPLIGEDVQDAFHKQMMQALEDLKVEVNAEKENLRQVVNQVQEIFDTMEAQKQKLQNFIEETRERFKTDYPTKSVSNIPETRSAMLTSLIPKENSSLGIHDDHQKTY